MSDVAGYFLWERSLNGPMPVKVADKDQYLYRAVRNSITPLIPLTAAQYRLTLDQLAASFPCPEQPS